MSNVNKDEIKNLLKFIISRLDSVHYAVSSEQNIDISLGLYMGECACISALIENFYGRLQNDVESEDK